MYRFHFLFFLSIFFVTIASGQDNYHSASEMCGKLDYYASQKCMIDKPIFEFNAVTYDDQKINSDDLKGKIMIINFWFMSCTPCMAELGGLNEIVDKYKNKGVEFISFTLDSKADLTSDFFPKHQLKFAVIPDSETFLIEELKHGWGFPTTFIVDQNGVIQKIISGGSTEEALANKEIKEQIIPELERLLLK